MTNLEALIGEVEPYTASPFTYSKKLLDFELAESGTYSAANKRKIAQCAVSVLMNMLPLSSDHTGKSSQTYDKKGLEERIAALCEENDIELPDGLAVPTVEVCPSII